MRERNVSASSPRPECVESVPGLAVPSRELLDSNARITKKACNAVPAANIPNVLTRLF